TSIVVVAPPRCSTRSTTAAISARSNSSPRIAQTRASATSSTPSPASSRAANHGPSAIVGNASSAVVFRKGSPLGRVGGGPAVAAGADRAGVGDLARQRDRGQGVAVRDRHDLAQRTQRRILGGPEQRRGHGNRRVLVECAEVVAAIALGARAKVGPA